MKLPSGGGTSVTKDRSAPRELEKYSLPPCVLPAAMPYSVAPCTAFQEKVTSPFAGKVEPGVGIISVIELGSGAWANAEQFSAISRRPTIAPQVSEKATSRLIRTHLNGARDPKSALHEGPESSASIGNCSSGIFAFIVSR